MSDMKCQDGDISGFPLRVSQSIFSDWPATKNSQAQIQKLIAPTDFVVNWGNPTRSAQISVTRTTGENGQPGVFQISGFDTIADYTTLAYGNASYTCSKVMSIVQNQHKNLNQTTDALYELILSFQISNKSDNPSSPDIILLTRPIIFTPDRPSFPFLEAVDMATVKNTTQSTYLDMSTVFGYNSSTLMPMVSYQTCLPVKLTNTDSLPYETMTGSIRMRVNVVMQPLYVNPSENGLGLCSVIKKYTLVTNPKRVVDIFLNNYKNPIFGGIATNVYIQFQDGFGSDRFPKPLEPSNKTNNLVPHTQSSILSSLINLLQKIEILVPEAFLGKSIADIANSKSAPKISSKKKAFKCYTVDPEKDIVDGQIMIDPTTGKSLKDTLSDREKDAAGGDATQKRTYYTLYGGEITSSIIVKNTIPIQNNSWNITDLTAFVAQDGGRVRIAFASSTDIQTVNQSLSYVGDSNNLNSTLFSVNNSTGDIIVSNGKRQIDATDDLQDDTGDININEVTVNSIDGSSGILAKDIEDMIVLVCIVVFSILLFLYLSFIAFKVLFRLDIEPFPTKHVIIFIVLLIGLSLLGAYSEKR